MTATAPRRVHRPSTATLPGPDLRVGRTSVPAYRLFALGGFALGVAASLAQAARLDVPTGAVLALAVLGALGSVGVLALRAVRGSADWVLARARDHRAGGDRRGRDLDRAAAAHARRRRDGAAGRAGDRPDRTPAGGSLLRTTDDELAIRDPLRLGARARRSAHPSGPAWGYSRSRPSRRRGTPAGGRGSRRQWSAARRRPS